MGALLRLLQEQAGIAGHHAELVGALERQNVGTRGTLAHRDLGIGWVNPGWAGRAGAVHSMPKRPGDTVSATANGHGIE